MSIVVLLFVFTMNIIHSLDLDAFLSMFNLFADIEIAADDYLFGLEMGNGEGILAIPATVRVELSKIAEDVETVYHYQLEAPVAFYGEDAERYCKAVLDSKDYFRFYEYDQIADFEVFEGSLDREKFESGEYVLAVAMDGDGTSLYHAGEVVELANAFPELEAYNFELDENYPAHAVDGKL